MPTVHDNPPSGSGEKKAVPIKALIPALQSQYESCESMLRQVDDELLNINLAMQQQRRVAYVQSKRRRLSGYRHRLLKRKCQQTEIKVNQRTKSLNRHRRIWRQSPAFLRVLKRRLWVKRIRVDRAERRKYLRHLIRYRRLLERYESPMIQSRQEQTALKTGLLRYWGMENKQRVLQLRRQRMHTIRDQIGDCLALIQGHIGDEYRKRVLVLPGTDLLALLDGGVLESAICRAIEESDAQSLDV